MKPVALTQASLEAALVKLRAARNDSAITLKPTKLLMKRLPHESFDDYLARVQHARDTIASFTKEKST